LDKVVELLYQEPTRDPDWFYQRVRCPLFRTVKREAGEPLIRSRVESGAWQVVKVKKGVHLCHVDPKKEARLGKDDGQRKVCILLHGLLGVQAGLPSKERPVTILSAIVTPGELVRHFGVAAKLGGCVHRNDELAAVYALKDSWVLTIPETEFVGSLAQWKGQEALFVNLTLGLMGSLFDAVSTNRVVERRLAGGRMRVRFVATMLAVAARHGEVEMTTDDPAKWGIVTNFDAPAQFYKGLARLKADNADWRQPLHLGRVLEIPSGKARGRVRLSPCQLVFPELWAKFEAELSALKELSDGAARAKGFRALCRDAAYAAYREEDRPEKDRLARYDFAPDCLADWEQHLAGVLPKPKKKSDPDTNHWLNGSLL